MTRSAPQSPSIESQQVSTCPVQPAVTEASNQDGTFPFQADLAGLNASDIGSFIVIAKESASAGRPRDAETALLMACRLADRLKGTGSIESADAKYQLGSHYATLAHDGPPGIGAGPRAEWMARAQQLYADSLETYQAKFGEADEKSRFAAAGLAAARQTLAQAQTPPLSESRSPETTGQAKEPASPAPGRLATSAAPRTTARKVEVAKAASTPRQTPGLAVRTQPSFDCRRARSIPEKMICSDAELSQLDRELGRVYARARKATSDGAGFRRQQNQEWLRRESSCRDRDCLLRWYEIRRDQLMKEIEGRPGSAATASR